MEQIACPYTNPVYNAIWALLEKGLNISNKVLLYRVYEGDLMFPKLVTAAEIKESTREGAKRLFMAYNYGHLNYKSLDNRWILLSANVEIPWEESVNTPNGWIDLPRTPILIATYSVIEDD